MNGQRWLYVLLAFALLFVFGNAISDGRARDLIVPLICAGFVGLAFGTIRLLHLTSPKPPVPGLIMLGTMIGALILGLFVFPSFDLVLLLSGASAAASMVVTAAVHTTRSKSEDGPRQSA